MRLSWHVDRAQPGGGDFRPSALPLGLTALGSSTSAVRARTTSVPAVGLDPTQADIERFDRHLTAVHHDGGLLALIAPPKLFAPARARLLGELELADASFEALLVGHVRRICAEEEIAWATLSDTDAAGPDGPNWGMLLALLDDAIAATVSELLDTSGVVLLRGLGVLARYRRMDALARLTAGDHALRGWWLLLADPGGAGRPTVDGQAVPIVSAAQWTRIPPAWARAVPVLQEAA